MNETKASGPPELLNMDDVRVDPGWALKIPAALAMGKQILPFASVNGRVYVACADTSDRATLEAVARVMGHPIAVKRAEPTSLRRALNRAYGSLAAGPDQPTARARPDDTATAGEVEGEGAVAVCDELMQAAVVRQASDIHIDADEKQMTVRMRVDGVLERYRSYSISAHPAVINRFKILARMDIAEKRAPQDGHFNHRLGQTGQAIDVRVATLPTKYGERMTLRLLALQTESLTLERLGMNESDLEHFSDAINKPHGLILITGPTGSGKSTTLYAAIRRIIGQRQCNIVTVEDPIEYDIAGVAQVEVDSADKVSFTKALRSILRHDPDIVMIGEIRDRETAEAAITASLTGHLVFSTLHTNSAASVVTRMADIGIERYLIAATLRLAVAQRLVRRLCSRCGEPRALTEAEAVALGSPGATGATVYEPAGCLYCANRGFVGRIGLFEMFPCDEALARRIAEGADEGVIIRELRERKIPRLLDDALEKICCGHATVREVLGAVTAW
jgi:general secretion pathway protein E